MSPLFLFFDIPSALLSLFPILFAVFVILGLSFAASMSTPKVAPWDNFDFSEFLGPMPRAQVPSPRCESGRDKSRAKSTVFVFSTQDKVLTPLGPQAPVLVDSLPAFFAPSWHPTLPVQPLRVETPLTTPKQCKQRSRFAPPPQKSCFKGRVLGYRKKSVKFAEPGEEDLRYHREKWKLPNSTWVRSDMKLFEPKSEPVGRDWDERPDNNLMSNRPQKKGPIARLETTEDNWIVDRADGEYDPPREEGTFCKSAADWVPGPGVYSGYASVCAATEEALLCAEWVRVYQHSWTMLLKWNPMYTERFSRGDKVHLWWCGRLRSVTVAMGDRQTAAEAAAIIAEEMRGDPMDLDW